MNNKNEIIAFFSLEGFFRLKSEEKQRARFEELKEDFEAEFLEAAFDDLEVAANAEYFNNLFDFLRQYQNEQKIVRKEREKKRLLAKNSLPIAGGCNKPTDHIKNLPAGKYVLTSAQNNTHANEVMLKCLLQFCRYKDAKLLIGRLTYNKSGFCQPDIDTSGLWYDQKIRPYLVQGHINLQGAHFLADANIIPTARNPLTGFSAATAPGEHIILPHTKIALQVDGALMGSNTKIVCSTGAITLPNYIMRKAGSVAALEHCISAVFVDTTNPNNVIIRHLELMPDCEYFYDLEYKYNVNNVQDVRGCNLAVLQPGDIHAEKMEEKNLVNLKDLIQQYQPLNLTLHDVLDFSSRNHHNVRNCAFVHKQTILENTVEQDLIKMADLIDDLYCVMPDDSDVYVIESNHDNALSTWLIQEDFKKDPVNAATYLKCMLAWYEHQHEHLDNDFNMLEYAYSYVAGGIHFPNLKFNKVGESLIIAHIEHSCHGHLGISGAKGSPTSFRKLGLALNTGHTHSPQICGKVYTAGVTASLDLGYNKGISSWSVAHIFTYENGQRQLIFC